MVEKLGRSTNFFQSQQKWRRAKLLDLEKQRPREEDGKGSKVQVNGLQN